MEIVWSITALFIVSQVLQFLGYIAQNATYVTKRRTYILTANIIAVGFAMGGFATLGAWAGFWMLGLSISRSIAFLAYEIFTKGQSRTRHFETGVLGLVVIGAILITAFTYDTWHDLFPFFSVIIASIGLWQRNVKLYRVIAIPMTLLWLVYMVMVGSLVGIIFESISLGVVITSVILYKKSVDNLTTDGV